jgi:transcriptional repressor NrdR
MRCPYCANEEDKVIESRAIEDGAAIRRRRECLKCGHRFTSYERLETQAIMVIKKDSRREPFDRQKILNGILKACEKRPVSMDTVEDMVSGIEKTIHDQMKNEVTSLDIGELVMVRLKAIDQIAYIRFASVYRQFKDLAEFLSEIRDHFKSRP